MARYINTIHVRRLEASKKFSAENFMSRKNINTLFAGTGGFRRRNILDKFF